MALTTISPALQDTQAQYTGFKNRLINGQMQIDQRNAGASVTPNNTYTLDRWVVFNSQTSKLTAQQNAGSITPPAGFTNYLGITSSSAYSVGAGDYFALVQLIEGFNVADLGWGSSGALPVTLSFWVRSSLTGTFGGSINNSGASRSYPFSYTISAANTWEQKSITISGDVTGTWLKTNGQGLQLNFALGVGSTYSGTAGSWSSSNYVSATGATSVVGTNGATFYITGVQLEKGSTATSFDYRPYGTELALCQRYYQKYLFDSGANALCNGTRYTSTDTRGAFTYAYTMRANPTGSSSTATNDFAFESGGTGFDYCNSLSFAYMSKNACLIYNNSEMSGTQGFGGIFYLNQSGAWIALTAEL